MHRSLALCSLLLFACAAAPSAGGPPGRAAQQGGPKAAEARGPLLPFDLSGGQAEEPRPARPLFAAAASLAALAEAGKAASLATDPTAVRRALGAAGSWSAQAHSFVARATTRQAALERVRAAATQALREAPEPFHEVGLGQASSGGSHTAVLLLARTYAALEAFPLRPELGATHSVQGALKEGLDSPELHLSTPAGRPLQLPLEREGGRFRGAIAFDEPGRWTLEITASGKSGPLVAALLTVEVEGGASRKETSRRERGDPPAPSDPREMERWIGKEVNELRLHHGLGPLLIDPLLSKAARAYAEELSSTGAFAHHSKRSGRVGDRLREAGYVFTAVGENLAMAPTAPDAQRSLEGSPKHLRLLLDPSWREAGIGIALDGKEAVILVQIFATP